MDPSQASSSPVRARRVIVMGVVLLLLVVVLFWPQAFNLHFRASPESTWLLFLISTISFLAVVILTFVLARQVVKLYAERRAQILGAQFKTKLVIGALALSLTPVICMFGFTYGLINRTLDKWFSQPVVEMRDANQSTLALLESFVTDNAQNEATAIARGNSLNAALMARDPGLLLQALQRRRTTLESGFAVVFDPLGHPLASFGVPAGYHPDASATGQRQLGAGMFVLTRAAIPGGGEVQVGMPVPPALIAQIAGLAQARDRYARMSQERRSLRLIYIGYLLLLTLAILFATTWMALHLSRLVTVPIAELAAATQEISSGNLAYRVQVGAQDELAVLVQKFNRMASELELNRGQIEASRHQLQAANQELEARRRYTEALLENTPSAVISLGADFAIERVNPAVARLFPSPQGQPPRLAEMFDPASLREVQHLLRKSERWPQASAQIEATAGGRALTLAATAAAVTAPAKPGQRRHFAGYVLVLEDLTDLLRMQKTAAWREVAQRMAHEIKNPLTPIALSAQRIRRRLGGSGVTSALPATDQGVILECAAAIEAEVHSLQRLVDEFSRFARFPHAQPVPCDLNEIITSALHTFDGRLNGIEIRTQLDVLPTLLLDRDDMRSVFVNLIDNAAEAMVRSPYRQITLATQQLDGVVEAVVADTGPGVPAGEKQRLVLPYYSTKERGTGLGLAIVQRILEENGGSLRVEDNAPIGARFVVEIPVEAAAEERSA